MNSMRCVRLLLLLVVQTASQQVGMQQFGGTGVPGYQFQPTSMPGVSPSGIYVPPGSYASDPCHRHMPKELHGLCDHADSIKWLAGALVTLCGGGCLCLLKNHCCPDTTVRTERVWKGNGGSALVLGDGYRPKRNGDKVMYQVEKGSDPVEATIVDAQHRDNCPGMPNDSYVEISYTPETIKRTVGAEEFVRFKPGRSRALKVRRRVFELQSFAW